MIAVTLRRIDPDKDMAWYYRLDIQPDLFGEWRFIREWGRIGRPGRVRSTPYPSPAEALAALERQRRVKIRKGYFEPAFCNT